MKKSDPAPATESQLLIRISDVPARGLPLTGALSAERMNNRLALAEGNDIQLLKDAPYDLLVNKQAGGGSVQGSVQVAFQQGCSRCLKLVEQTRTVKIGYLLKEQPADDPAEAPYVDDVGVHCYASDKVDLENLLQEEIILAMDPFFRPAIDDRGRCELCDQECSDRVTAPEKRTLGDLLKPALTNPERQRKRNVD